jgi:pimeloyl-ACP methyl ester carboxylesterase
MKYARGIENLLSAHLNVYIELNMPYTSNEGVKIHYEIEGQGPPLVLQHGFSGNTQEWRDLPYAEALKSGNRLVLIDARGHGESDKPLSRESYSGKLMTGDVVAVLDDAGIDRAGYFGYSMGGWIGFNLINRHPERFTCFILGGMSPYPFRLEDSSVLSFIREILKAGQEGGPSASIAWVESFEGAPIAEFRRKGYYEMDFQALAALYEVMSLELAHGLSLHPVGVPCLIFAGERDEFYAGAKRSSQELLNARFVSLSGIEHIQAFAETSIVIPEVRKFLAEVWS